MAHPTGESRRQGPRGRIAKVSLSEGRPGEPVPMTVKTAGSIRRLSGKFPVIVSAPPEPAAGGLRRRDDAGIVINRMKLHERVGGPFTLVLAGGGARGLAHAGVLRALEHYGLRPHRIIGISMGAIVAAAYALNPDWYRVVLETDAPHIHQISNNLAKSAFGGTGEWLASVLAVHRLASGWGVGPRTVQRFMSLLQGITLGRSLEDAKPRLSVVATDMLSGETTVLDQGDASEAVYASCALAGVLPPLRRNGQLLADGGYGDLAPLRSLEKTGPNPVIVVDPDHFVEAWVPDNGLQAMVRALEVTMEGHARGLFRDADLVLRPRFTRPIHAFDFGKKRAAIAAGARAVRGSADHLRRLAAA